MVYRRPSQPGFSVPRVTVCNARSCHRHVHGLEAPEAVIPDVPWGGTDSGGHVREQGSKEGGDGFQGL